MAELASVVIILEATSARETVVCPSLLLIVDGGGVRINGEKVGDRTAALRAGECVVLQVGKRKFARVTLI